MQLTHLRDLGLEAPLASGHAFVSAASGMVLADDRLCVVADDGLSLAVFAPGGAAPGRLVPLLAGDLPRDPAARKRVKPDFEILLALPGGEATRLLALGSGSTAQRMRGALVTWPVSAPAPEVRAIDLAPLFAALAPLVAQVNLEGEVVDGTRLLLFNRGNMRFPASQVLAVPLAAVIGAAPPEAQLLAELALPALAGVPLTVTDACRLEDGHILLAAVAEATADSYADGGLAGAAIAELDPHLRLLAVEVLDPPLKIEGLTARAVPGGLDLLCATDADDPEQPAGLYAGFLRRGGVGDAKP